MSTSPYSVRDYVSGDEQQILELYRLAFGPITEKYWRWRYLENPYGRAIVKLMFSGETLVGQYAIQPMELDLLGTRVRACFSLDTMTHPAHRGKGIFTDLATRAFDEAKESGYVLVYGFPNRNSFPGFTGKLGWVNCGNTKELYTELRESNAMARQDVRFSARFPAGTADLWSSVRSRLNVIGVPRDSRFLKWRFDDASGSTYSFAEHFDPRGRLTGYMALKVYQNQIGHVVDILAADQETAVAMIASAIDRFRKEGLAQFSCWLPARMSHGLDTLGLSERVNTWTFFCFKDLQQLDAEVHQRDYWFLTMADSDVY